LSYGLKLLASLVTAFSGTRRLSTAESLTGMSCWQVVSCGVSYLWSLDFSWDVLSSYGFLSDPSYVRVAEGVRFLVWWDS